MHDTAPRDRSAGSSRSGTGGLEDAALTYEIVDDAGGVVVSLRGELDLASAPEVQRQLLALLARPVTRVTIDLKALTFLDSSGLGALYRARRAADARGVPLALENVPDHVMRVLDVTAMAPLFDLESRRG